MQCSVQDIWRSTVQCPLSKSVTVCNTCMNNCSNECIRIMKHLNTWHHAFVDVLKLRDGKQHISGIGHVIMHNNNTESCNGMQRFPLQWKYGGVSSLRLIEWPGRARKQSGHKDTDSAQFIPLYWHPAYTCEQYLWKCCQTQISRREFARTAFACQAARWTSCTW